MKEKTTTSQKPGVSQQTGGNTSSTVSKSGESTRTRKRTKEISSNQTSANGRVHDTQSDISADEAEDPVPYKRRRISMIHSYAEKLSDVEYRCTLCTKLIRCGVGTNSNIKRHLINVHDLKHLKPKHDSSVPKRPFDAYRKAKLDKAAMKCIVLDGRPFGDFRKNGMKNFLATALPGYDGPPAMTVTRTIKKLYADKLMELQKELNNTPYVCLTTDLWRRPKKHHYLCVTVHYLDSAYLNISKVLSFRRFHGRHFGARIRNHLNRIVHKFQLESKIVAIVSDNGGDMRVATQQPDVFGVRLYCLAHGLNNTIQKALEFWKKKDKQDTSANSTRPQDDDDPDDVENEEESTDGSSDEEEKTSTPTTAISVDSDGSNVVNDDFDSNDEDQYQAPRDDTDIISSDEDMEEDDDELSNHPFIIDNINYILANCRKIVNAINRSTILYQNIQNLARSTVNGDLIIDMRIRWNSTCKMITRLLQYRPILTVFMNHLSSMEGVPPKKKQKLLKMQLSYKEWNVLDNLNATLVLFSDASDMLSGSKYPSYSMAYLVIDSLYHYLQSSTTNDIEETIKHELSETFQKYVYHSPGSSEHNLLLICAFLDPVVHDLMDDHDKISAKKILIIEANGTRGTTQNVINIPSSSMLTTDSPVITISSTTNTSTAERLKLFRAKCGIVEQEPIPTKSKTLTLRQEVAKFESLDKTEYSFATFWQKYECTLPLLSKMARRYGSVPASSVPSESSFSVAGYTARKNRSSLTAKNLKYSMFLKDKI